MAGKGTAARPRVSLACSECKSRNYMTAKNRRTTPERLELVKYCPRCGRRTLHRETR